MEQKLIRDFGKNTSRNFISKKNLMKKMKAESWLEISGMYYLEFDDNILRYNAQPISILYEYQGKTRRYTPDLLVQNSAGEYQFREVKPRVFSNTPAFLEKLGVLNDAFLTQFGIPLKVWTDEDFLHPVLNEHYRRLYCYRGYDFSRYCLGTVKEHLVPCENVSDVYEVVSRFNATSAFASALFATKKVLIDLYKPFNLGNSIEVNIDA
jgi:hypothetical protein